MSKVAIQGNTRPTLVQSLLQALILTGIMMSSLGGYLAVLKWRGSAATVVTAIPLDEYFPFWPSWVWVYLFPYLLAPVLTGMLTPVTFWWFIKRGLFIVGVALAIFVIFPTKTSGSHRGSVTGTDLTAALYRNMAEIDDPPANAAPSLHVSLTFLLALALIRDFPRWSWAWMAFVGIVWFSTLVTRQHHLIDVATGVLLAWAVVLLFGGRRRPV
jgi:membrane-associated phospholipid phosphatase